MSELWIVLQREFLERARSRSYLVSTLLTPLFVALFFLVPVLLDPGPPPPPRIAVVDESGVGLGEAVEAALGAAEPAAEVGLIRRPLALVEDSLATLLALGAGVDGLLWIPPDALRRGAATYRFRSAGARALEGRISLALSGALVEARLRGLGMDPAVAAATFAPARLRSTPVGAEAAPGADGAGLLFAMMVGLALYFLILLYGVQVMQSVQEEKSNRIAEVLVSSIRASHLMLGKVLGVGLAALLQVAVWTAVTALLVRRREAIAELLGGRADLLAGIPAPPATAATGAMVAFAVLGFFLYASLFAAAGAAAASTEDAQRFTIPLIAPLVVPVLLAEAVVEDPSGTLATVLGWIPLTSPLVMPMRLGAGALGTAEVAGPLLLLLLSVWAMGTLAGKVYRVGILSTGKRPSLAELLRWARSG